MISLFDDSALVNVRRGERSIKNHLHPALESRLSEKSMPECKLKDLKVTPLSTHTNLHTPTEIDTDYIHTRVCVE